MQQAIAITNRRQNRSTTSNSRHLLIGPINIWWGL